MGVILSFPKGCGGKGQTDRHLGIGVRVNIKSYGIHDNTLYYINYLIKFHPYYSSGFRSSPGTLLWKPCSKKEVACLCVGPIRMH